MYAKRTWDDALSLCSLNSLSIQKNSLKTWNKIEADNKHSQLISETQLSTLKATYIFLFIYSTQIDVWEEHNMYKQCQSLSWLSQIIITIPHPPLPSSLLSYTSLLFLYLDWKPGPRCKGDSTLQLWCRAWSVWLSSGLLSQKDSFLEWCLVVTLLL